MTGLELDAEDIEAASGRLAAFFKTYQEALRSGPVMPEIDRAALEALARAPFPDRGRGVDALFDEIERTVAPNSTRIAHARFMAYVIASPNGIAPFADAVAAALNQNCNFWQLSPAASVIESKVVRWLADLFRFPESAGGLILSGGSAASLVAVSTALHARLGADFREEGLQGRRRPLTLYTSEEAHRCIEKDAIILGLGRANVRKIPVDADFRIRLDLLAERVAEDRRAGCEPFCVVATGGAINTGAVDDLPALSDWCRREDLWLHVDGAYGALFVLAEETRALLETAGLADSLALDPHKLLFAPLEAGCLIVRDRALLRQAFSVQASYLTVEDDPLFTNFLDYGPQLSRSFKAFKIWCALEAFGVEAFREAVSHMVRLAKGMEAEVRARPEFEFLGGGLSAVCFRLRGLDDQGNIDALADLVASGEAILGPVSLNGRRGLRACFNSFRTTPDDVVRVLDRLAAIADRRRAAA